ncbi:hypothetical protein [Erythrobacter sp. THAF29]|uniref:hypothetical protein n=1 Tax=Erythrobacter sp. THAF29 TaxID=2587851 RepID=UPI001268C8F3|nr:hypothetical protein [Erythrobacter sp. THAF29]QFT77944.1 hypothetical protein FIU90_10390 [Erythrobacter sp. THAF29]
MAENPESLPAEIELALAYTPTALRERLRTVFALDQRLGRIAAATTEPMLGQMRIAWWRDMLGTPVADRPRGDAVLDAIGAGWAGEEHTLTQLIDGWEVLIVAESLDDISQQSIAAGRSAPITAVFGDCSGETQKRIAQSAQTYIYADLASRFSDSDERSLSIRLGNGLRTQSGRLPGNARGIGVLEALARRSLSRGGRPLMEGRGASLVALKAGIFGR